MSDPKPAKKLSRRRMLSTLGTAGALPLSAFAGTPMGKGHGRTKVMLLLTYTPREDVNLEEYHAWLRSIDNPFFNSRPSVHYYSNWRVIDAKVGPKSFTHFDLLEVRNLDGYEQVFGDSKIVEFAKNWVRKWGRNPDPELPDQSVNYQVFLCERVAAPTSDMS